MDTPFPPRRIAGALGFLAELESVATECAAGGTLNDELTARRQQRDEALAIGHRVKELQVKAL